MDESSARRFANSASMRKPRRFPPESEQQTHLLCLRAPLLCLTRRAVPGALALARLGVAARVAGGARLGRGRDGRLRRRGGSAGAVDAAEDGSRLQVVFGGVWRFEERGRGARASRIQSANWQGERGVWCERKAEVEGQYLVAKEYKAR